MMKKNIKKLFVGTKTLSLLDKILFIKSVIINYPKNYRFKKTNNNFLLPPDYFLYETYRLNYQAYYADGLLTAKETITWATKYKPIIGSVLEWGCGVARVIRHLPYILGKDCSITGVDINSKMIEWNKKYISSINFQKIDYLPPTDLISESYDLIYGLSVFTHIDKTNQEKWLIEINRLLKSGGIFLFTSHGLNYFDKLDKKECEILEKDGSYTVYYQQAGHRMMTTYNIAKRFKEQIEKYFEVLEFVDGKKNFEKVGGQDLWIVRKF